MEKTAKGRGRKYWAPIVAEFEKRSDGQYEFCEVRGLSLSSFRQWLYRLRREGAEPSAAKAQFLPLVPAKATVSMSDVACRLRVGNSELSFSVLPPANYIAELLRQMES